MAIIRKKNITFPAFRFLDRDGGLGLDTFIGTTCVADCGWSVTSVCAGSKRDKDICIIKTLEIQLNVIWLSILKAQLWCIPSQLYFGILIWWIGKIIQTLLYILNTYNLWNSGLANAFFEHAQDAFGKNDQVFKLYVFIHPFEY